MWSESRTETVKAVPVDVAFSSFRVNVLAVGKVETAVIVLGAVSYTHLRQTPRELLRPQRRQP